MTLWQIIDKVSKFVVPDRALAYLKKHPFQPIIVVLGLWLISVIIGSVFGDKEFSLKIPCTTIFGGDCFQKESPQEAPFRGFY